MMNYHVSLDVFVVLVSLCLLYLEKIVFICLILTFLGEYNEVPDIPAYQNDNRFEPVKFRWIDTNFSKYYSKDQNEEKPSLSALHSCLNVNFVHHETQNLRTGEKINIFNGVLSQSDIFCLKYVESLSSDATLLWFINFLIHKDLQAKFTFLRTCLVETMHGFSDSPYLCEPESKKFNFEVIVKK